MGLSQDSSTVNQGDCLDKCLDEADALKLHRAIVRADQCDTLVPILKSEYSLLERKYDNMKVLYTNQKALTVLENQKKKTPKLMMWCSIGVNVIFTIVLLKPK